MIITHTLNANGQPRIYLGGKGSLECWLEPDAKRQSWTFHAEEAVTGNQLTEADKRDWAIHMLMKLATALDVTPNDLASVPFEAIAALHTEDPFACRRIATPRRQAVSQGYMATKPNITRPRGDFASEPDANRPKNMG